MSASSHDELIAELYGLPLDEFTSARDALAKRLRAGGERKLAKQVKALRKPSVTAWAVNRVRRREPERVEELLDAGARLREAQQRVIRSGQQGQLRDAGARERDLVESLVDSAATELAASGHAASPASRSRVFATLHAAAGDHEARALLSAGRLVRDYELSDLALGLGVGEGGADTPAPELSPSAPQPRKQSERVKRDVAVARERLEQATDARVRAREKIKAAEREARAAETDLADAEDRWRDAAVAVEQFQSALTHATQRLDSARIRSAQADELVAERERALGELSP
jgi:hypothetical protein